MEEMSADVAAAAVSDELESDPEFSASSTCKRDPSSVAANTPAFSESAPANSRGYRLKRKRQVSDFVQE